MTGQTLAIVRVQLQSLRNYGRRAGMGTVLTILASIIWYGLWLAGTILFTKFIAGARPEQASSALTAGLFIIFLYWQITPLLMAATGFALDMRKLLVYPIAPARLFRIDLVLRAITSLESIFLLAGASIGVLMNGRLHKSGALAIGMFIALNLFVAAGVREIVIRLFARRRTRELLVLVIVLLAATPQLIVVTKAEDKVTGVARRLNLQALPWSAAASASTGSNASAQILVVGIWTAGAYVFGRRQFQKSLTFDADAAGASGPAKASSAARLIDHIQRWPSQVFRDPLAALLEKEIRTLARSPRFRLVFLMGFSFGLLIWFPISLGRGGGGFMGRHFLSVVSAYALLLLGDVCFWNCFGFDRGAAQAYLVVPVRFRTVLLAKNLAAFGAVLLEVVMIALVCAALRFPIPPLRALEALVVAIVLSVFLLAVGNLTSVYSPKPMNPMKSSRSGAPGKTQMLLLVTYPVLMAPIALAYAAQWALDSEAALFGVLAITGVVGLCFYAVAMDSAEGMAQKRREDFVAALSKGAGPIE